MTDVEYVGGPLDGKRGPLAVSFHAFDRAVLRTAPARSGLLDYNGSWTIQYHPTRIPGRRTQVMFAAGATWPDRYDTDAWPQEAAPERARWTRCGDWAWRGDGVADETLAGAPVEPLARDSLARTVTYLLGLPEYRRIQWLRQDVPRELVDTRDDVLAALQGKPTAGDMIIDQLREYARYERLPGCPAPGCDSKASVTLRARTSGAAPLWLPGVIGGWSETVECCPEHAAKERGRLDSWGQPLWDVIPTANMTHRVIP